MLLVGSRGLVTVRDLQVPLSVGPQHCCHQCLLSFPPVCLSHGCSRVAFSGGALGTSSSPWPAEAAGTSTEQDPAP